MSETLKTSSQTFIGTAAERAAMTTTTLKAGAYFEETDTGLVYEWSGAAWFVASKESVGIVAGSSIIGKVGIDQTTDGTTNKVQARNATHGDFQVNATMQLNDADVSNGNPVPIVDKNTDTAPAAAPVTVDTTADGTVIAAANANRLSITLQNVSTVACLIRLGGDPSAAAYNFVLSADSAAKAGNGGSITIQGYTGAIKGITEAGNAVIAVTEVV